MMAIASKEASEHQELTEIVQDDEFNLGFQGFQDAVVHSLYGDPLFDSAIPLSEMIDSLRGLFDLVDLLVDIDRGYQNAEKEYSQLREAEKNTPMSENLIDLQGFYHMQTLALRNIFQNISSLIAINAMTLRTVAKTLKPLKPLADFAEEIIDYFKSKDEFQNENSIGFTNFLCLQRESE